MKIFLEVLITFLASVNLLMTRFALAGLRQPTTLPRWMIKVFTSTISPLFFLFGLALLPERKRAILDSLFTASRVEAGFSLDQVIGDAIEEYKKMNWNASRLDFAYALLLQSPDSLISNIKLNEHLFWTTMVSLKETVKFGPKMSAKE